MIGHLLLYWIPPLFAVVMLIIGVVACLAPLPSARMFGIPTRDPGFVIAAGARDIFIGAVIVELWRLENFGSMARLFLIVTIVPLGDAYATYRAGNKAHAAAHAASAIACAIYASLLMWLLT